jgi:O-antigen ligase
MTESSDMIQPLRSWARNGRIDHSRIWLSILLFGFLSGGLFFKSFFFADGEPVAINYIFNGLFIGGLFIAIWAIRGFITVSRSIILLFLFSVIWASISSWISGIAMNYVATFSMVIMLAGCFYAVPLACLRLGLEPWRILGTVIVPTVLISLVLFVVLPASATDPVSGRFSGFYISVAVACNFFFFGTVIGAANAQRARSRLDVYWNVGIAVLSFSLLYLTRTRSSLLETLFCLTVLCTFSPMQRGVKMLVLTIIAWFLVLGIVSGTAVTTGLVSIDEQMREFRLADRSITDARDSNWDFGLLRMAERPLFGEGLLTKQTDGGTKAIDLGEGGSYNPVYDPHSLPLSLAVEGGIPFMLAIMGIICLILARFVRRFGLVRSLQSPDFVIVATHFPIMMLAGGDLTTLGNMVEKVFWILVGSLEIKNSLVQPGDPRYRERSLMTTVVDRTHRRALRPV